MKNEFNLAVLIIILLFMGCNPNPSEVGEMKFQEGSVQHVVHAGNIGWKPCPSHLPSGCELTVLEGNPKTSDLFTVRFQLDEGFVMPPHTHPKDERVTVISGKVAVAFGPDATREDAKVFVPGDYYVNKRDEIHTVWSDTNSIVQVTGIGPWEADFIEK